MISKTPSATSYLILLFILYVVLAGNAFAQHVQSSNVLPAQSAGEDTNVNIFVFWSPTCPHCRDALGYINTLPKTYPWITLHSHNVVDFPESAYLFQQMAAAHGEEARSVPSIFVCGQLFVGWDSPEGVGNAIVQAAQSCRSENGIVTEKSRNELQAPLIGKINADDYSLPLFTLIVAGLDAFNPCAFFVLLFLLSLLVHARSRTRMLLIGGTFVLISGLVYFVFMAAWLNFFLVVGNVGWITLGAGLVAVVIGIFGIKDFLLAFRGPSLSISADDKSRLFGRVRGLLSIDSMPALLAGTIMLALAANTYELLCTAGFPMVYTRTLTLHGLDSTTYYLYLAFYNLIYVIPLMVIVVLFTLTLGARKLTVSQGRLLKLLSGSMMLELGLVLLFQPGLLNNVTTGLILLLIAIVVTLIARQFARTNT
jgi:glutaredoxin